MDSQKDSISSKLLSNLRSVVEISKDAVTDMASLVEDNADDERSIKVFEEFVRLSSDYVIALENLSSLFAVDLNWLPPSHSADSTQDSSEYRSCTVFPSPHFDLHYADGQTPWSFWLAYKPSSDFYSLQQLLLDEWAQGTLKRLSQLPEPGSYVICTERNIIFRAIVLSTHGDKARVRNVDDSRLKVVKLENIYSMKKKFNSVHAQTVQCCLTKDESLTSLWNSDLCELLKNTLKEGDLKVSFVEECADCVPAKFLASVSSWGEAVVDFNAWICDKLFPELIKYQDCSEELTLEDLPESVTDPYYSCSSAANFAKGSKDIMRSSVVEINKKLDTGIKGRAWSSQLFALPNLSNPNHYLNSNMNMTSPFPVGQMLATQYTATLVYSGSGMDPANLFAPPPQITTSNNFTVKPDVSNTTLNVNTPVFKPRKTRIPILSPDESPIFEDAKPKPSPSKQTPDLVKQSSTTNLTEKDLVSEEMEICPTYSKNGFCLSCCNKRHIKSYDKDQTKLNPNEVKQPPRYDNHPSAGVAVTDGTVNTEKLINLLWDKNAKNNPVVCDRDIDWDDDDEDLEEPCISGGYIPTDERRLCRFPSKNGKCWKPLCKQEHQETSKFKWTTDQQATVQRTFNYLNLPNEGETIELVVTTVLNSYTFYARLPNVYSDIGEGVEDTETFYTLHKSLNHPKNIKGYKTLPGIDAGDGEMYLVLSLDNHWKRATVIESSEKKALVFYVDYGINETVSESALRLMEDRFNHLPAQAVRCTLSGVLCSLDDFELRQRGKKYLKDLIEGQVIIGKVDSRNVEETSLDIFVTFNSMNVNNVMVGKGYCDLMEANRR